MTYGVVEVFSHDSRNPIVGAALDEDRLILRALSKMSIECFKYMYIKA